MQTIGAHRVQFGELAGPLVHGGTFFDWEMISTQEIAAAFDYSFEEILATDGIPYAPVVLRTSVERYPGAGDEVTVETVPRDVGETSLELVYEITDGDDEPLATARMTHVTIDSGGEALVLPERARSNFSRARVDRTPDVGPGDGPASNPDLPTFSSSFRINAAHIEGAELAYFEEYPRFAAIALETFLAENGRSLGALQGDKLPFRIRDWRWEFGRTVPFESILDVECDVVAVDRETVRIAHTFSIDGDPNIEAITEYGCFDRSGRPVPFDEPMLAPFETGR
jgi:acyl-CoA thioesterase FadM